MYKQNYLLTKAPTRSWDHYFAEGTFSTVVVDNDAGADGVGSSGEREWEREREWVNE